MPTYEYKCQDCGYKFESFQGIKDEPLEKCPKCNGKVQLLISGGAGIIFKGSGFYATDYATAILQPAVETNLAVAVIHHATKGRVNLNQAPKKF